MGDVGPGKEGSNYELLWSAVSEKLDNTGLKFVNELDETKRIIDNDVKGLLLDLRTIQTNFVNTNPI